MISMDVLFGFLKSMLLKIFLVAIPRPHFLLLHLLVQPTIWQLQLLLDFFHSILNGNAFKTIMKQIISVEEQSHSQKNSWKTYCKLLENSGNFVAKFE